MKNTALLFLVLVLALPFASAQLDLGISCEDESICLSWCEPSWGCFCSEQTNSCHSSLDPFAEQAFADEEPVSEQDVFYDEETGEYYEIFVEDSLPDEQSELQANLNLAQDQVAVLETFIEQQPSTSREELAVISQAIDDLRAQISQTQNQLSSLEQSLEQKENTLATGLAGLQTDLGATQDDVDSIEIDLEKERKATRFITILIIGVLIALTAIILVRFMTRKPVHKLDSATKQFITAQISQGIKYPQIEQQLIDAGWSKHDAQHAFKQTMKENYRSFHEKREDERKGVDKSKIAFIAIFALLLILALLFVARGVVVGNAIAASGGLEFQVTNLLTNYKDSFLSSPELKELDICVQVEQAQISTSVLITNNRVQSSPIACDQNAPVDLAIKFKNMRTFERTLQTPTCELVAQSHTNSNIIVLPSRFILPGFSVNPLVDYTPYCEALSSCLSAEQLSEVGC